MSKMMILLILITFWIKATFSQHINKSVIIKKSCSKGENIDCLNITIKSYLNQQQLLVVLSSKHVSDSLFCGLYSLELFSLMEVWVY